VQLPTVAWVPSESSARPSSLGLGSSSEASEPHLPGVTPASMTALADHTHPAEQAERPAAGRASLEEVPDKRRRDSPDAAASALPLCPPYRQVDPFLPRSVEPPMLQACLKADLTEDGCSG
jgi:hypothetical protein